MSRITICLQLLLALTTFLVFLQHSARAQSSQPLSCQTDADCQKQSNHSKCSPKHECICTLGFLPNNSSCVQAKCSNTSDCTAHFANTTCSTAQSPNASICICDSVHYLDDATQSCLPVDSQSGGYWWIGIVIGVFLIILLAAVCFLNQYKSRRADASRLLGSNDEHQENIRQDYNTIREGGAE